MKKILAAVVTSALAFGAFAVSTEAIAAEQGKSVMSRHVRHHHHHRHHHVRKAV